ncbi:MAG: hypothetical protein O2931_06285 [Planctomycetota bacterium]|nr:hypothetical protein [Verrucomicrobiota bacterium]MDA1178389.1 hypothetical protein [Planctomycetota bacterium]
MPSKLGGQDSDLPLIRVTHDVSKRFNPLGTVQSTVWRKSLQRLRERFTNAAARHHVQLTCVLKQFVIVPGGAKTPDLPDLWETDDKVIVAFGRGLHRQPRGRPDLDLDVGSCSRDLSVGDTPACEPKGKPIVLPAGRSLPIGSEVFGQYSVYANGSPKHQEVTYGLFDSTATDAGQCLVGLPVEVNRVVWRDWLGGFDAVDNRDMWVNALFEIAWQRIPGSPLVASKFAWNGRTSVPLDALPKLRLQGESGVLLDDLAKIPDPPTHWYSVITDLSSASVYAIDLLLAIGDANATLPRATDISPLSAEGSADVDVGNKVVLVGLSEKDQSESTGENSEKRTKRANGEVSNLFLRLWLEYEKNPELLQAMTSKQIVEIIWSKYKERVYVTSLESSKSYKKFRRKYPIIKTPKRDTQEDLNDLIADQRNDDMADKMRSIIGRKAKSV